MQVIENIGLPNIDNSCYVNVIIQIILHNPDLRHAFESKFGTDGDVIARIRNLYTQTMNISNFEQCDAVWFFNWMLDELDPTFHFIWKLNWKTTFVCTDCKKKTDNKQSENLWYIYQPDNIQAFYDTDNQILYDGTMSDIIYKQIISSVSKNCCQDKINVEHTSIKTLSNYPIHLFFNFQQFKGKKIVIYETLELIDPNKNIKYIYELQGVIVHIGTEMSGHYKIYLLDTNGWKLYNDMMISEIDDINDELIKQTKSNVSYPLLWYNIDHEETL